MKRLAGIVPQDVWNRRRMAEAGIVRRQLLACASSANKACPWSERIHFLVQVGHNQMLKWPEALIDCTRGSTQVP
jgi:hypothetical protein